MQNNISIKNKKAAFEYILLAKYTAGVCLTGTEIKSIRLGKVSINESYCTFIKNELFIRNMHIAEYEHGTYNNHDPKRDRKLLLTKRELRKISFQIKEKGLTVIPTLLYINEKGLVKIEIAVARGKKLYDKRETLKAKDLQRDINHKIKARYN